MFVQLTEKIRLQAENILKNLDDRIDQIEKYLDENPWENSSIEFNSIVSFVQNQLRQFIETSEHLIIWLELEIPSYNDCDEFRLNVLNEILDDFVAMKSSQMNSLTHLLDYREQRAAASKSLLKHPELDDNQQLIRFLDRQVSRQTRLMLVELKTSLFRQCHLIEKNHRLIEQKSSSRALNNYF